jgi:hypothetical protein
MAQVFLDTVKLYYEESKAAREQAEGLLEKYRTNTSTLLALAPATVAFFGFSTGPRQLVFYWISIGFYLLAVAISFLIFKPIPMKLNVAYNTAEQSSIPVDQDLLCGLHGRGGVVGPFDEFAVLELRAGADERHEMGRVDRPPA